MSNNKELLITKKEKEVMNRIEEIKNIKKEIPVQYGDTLDTVIQRLLDAKENGESAYSVFNYEHIFESDTISFDSAYIEIYGYTKKEKEVMDRIEEIKDIKKEIPVQYGDTLDTVIQRLLDAKENGENAYSVFNYEHIFESDTVSFDSAYMEIHGCIYEEYLKEDAFKKTYKNKR